MITINNDNHIILKIKELKETINKNINIANQPCSDINNQCFNKGYRKACNDIIKLLNKII